MMVKIPNTNYSVYLRPSLADSSDAPAIASNIYYSYTGIMPTSILDDVGSVIDTLEMVPMILVLLVMSIMMNMMGGVA